MKNVSVAPMSRKNLREFALRVRQLFGLEDEMYFPIVPFIEFVLPDLGFDYEVVPIHELGNAYGVTHTGIKVMKIREDVYDGAVGGNARDRFTLAHELGHFLLHTPDRVSFARGDIPAYMNPEWQANVFAGELLAPCNMVQGMSVDEVVCKCGISYTAAQIQMKEYKRAM